LHTPELIHCNDKELAALARRLIVQNIELVEITIRR